MEIKFEPESYKREDALKMPAQFALTDFGEDSGYLSHGSYRETPSIGFNASVSESHDPSDQLSSPRHDEGISAPLNSMELSDFSSSSNFSQPQFSQSLGILSGVYQSTPTIQRLCVNVHKEFDFVTPLPGPSHPRRFNLVGQNHVDILSILSQYNLQPPLHQILSHLEPSDLCQLRMVSSSWRKLLNSFPQAKVWRDFVRARRQNKENSALSAVKHEENPDLLVTPVSTRGQLRDIQNFVLVPTQQSNHSPPVSPSKMHSSRYFKEGQKLKSGEKLRKCPKCAWPSRADNSKIGFRCTGRLCGFHFCMDCSGPFHDNTPCAEATPKTPTKARNRGNKINKKRLHRLLL